MAEYCLFYKFAIKSYKNYIFNANKLLFFISFKNLPKNDNIVHLADSKVIFYLS